MRIHFIAVGGSIMHSLAIAMVRDGHDVSGSDDEIYEPARSRLRQAGILPDKTGWSSERITPEIESAILGMHALADNPELLAAQRLGIPIYSFPEFVAERCDKKKRVVICGSHGKTTITSAVMHVLRHDGVEFDFVVGSKVPGFEHQVELTADRPLIVIEGDEYLSSAIDARPKFMHYRPDLCVITGIAWDHMNVFPTIESYRLQFELLIKSMMPGSVLIANTSDPSLNELINRCAHHLTVITYETPEFEPSIGGWKLKLSGSWVQTGLIGRHNMENLVAVNIVCKRLGVSDGEFATAISSFKGPARRLELLKSNERSVVFNDFAHAPSKVQATINAVREQFPKRKLIAVIELHTYSSLNREFLVQYKDTARDADRLIVFLNHHAMQQKGLEVNADEVLSAFDHSDAVVISTSDQLLEQLSLPLDNTSLLMMSSGNFNGMDLQALANLAIP